MASCLGMYIENNLIKYAKVTKERDTLKVDSFGVKFYDQIGTAINQIISETYSYKIPICQKKLTNIFISLIYLIKRT